MGCWQQWQRLLSFVPGGRCRERMTEAITCFYMHIFLRVCICKGQHTEEKGEGQEWRRGAVVVELWMGRV